MESKLSLNNLSVDELLSNLNKNDSEDILYTNDVLNFVSVFQIKSGTIKNTTKILYRLYRIWSKEPLSMMKFSTELSLFITRDESHFLTNVDPIKVRLLISKLSLNGKRDIVRNKTYRKKFEKFLNTFEIKKGEYWIESYVLYKFYDKYCYENNIKRAMSMKSFESMCNIFFKMKRIKNIRHFKVHEDFIKKVTIESIENIRNAKEKTQQKGTKSVPSSKT